MLGIFKRNDTQQTATKPRPKRHPLARAAKRLFDAGSSDRLTESWTTMPLAADDIIRRNQRVLVARSREQAANNDYARNFLRMCRQNIVGPRGVVLQAQAKDPSGQIDQPANDAIEKAFATWGKRDNADVTGQLSWRSIQNQCVNSAAKDGEFMVRKIFGPDSGPWGFSMQLLDPQRCPVDLDQDRLPGGQFIRHGIEFTRYGRPVAYYFSSTSPSAGAYQFHGRNFERVPADEIIHGFSPDIIGQKRGLPWMSTALWRLNMLGGFEKAALVNARAGANKMGFFTWDEGYGPEADEDEEVFVDGEPGTWQELPAGVRPHEYNPQYPNGEFQPFHKSMLRGISSGFGVAYNNLANDLEGVNFSSIRQGTLDEREHWKDLQEWLIEVLIQPVFDEWLPHSLIRGRIRVAGKPLKPERIDKYRDVAWQPRRWQWIDPARDVKSAIDSKNAFLQSPGGIIREQGRDPDTVWREVSRDIESMRRSGIPEEYIHAALGGQLQPTGVPDATNND